MAGLDNLIDKIISKAEQEAESIISKAKEEADIIISHSKSALNKEIEKISTKNSQERNLIKEQLKSSAELKARNAKLFAKQKLISEIFSEVMQDLKSMSDEEYIDYIKSHSTIKDAVIVVVQDKLNICNEKLQDMKISQTRFVDSGFIEVTDTIENNYTFDSRINLIKEEVEGRLAEILFN